MVSGYGVVLVGIDGSEVAGAALEFAANEAHLRGARLVIAHAAGAAERATAENGERPFAEVVCQEAMAKVAAMHPHVECEVVRRDGDPAALLVELGATADLLVVGTHRTGRLRGWVLGSVSQYVAAHALCPVVTISGTPERASGPVVLGASATPGGLAAMRFACEEARVRAVPVRAVRSITTEDWALSGPGYAMMLGADVLHDAAQAELDTVVTTAKELYPDVTISGEVTSANPFTALLVDAADASLLVIGSRRDQEAALPHLGPVAAWLLHQAACPLAVAGYTKQDTAAAALGAGER